ncbi:hypothetical protein ACIRSS_25665 [Amycolatopsis sp. NPDC101161]
MTLRFLITTVAQTARADRADDERDEERPAPHPETPEGAPR